METPTTKIWSVKNVLRATTVLGVSAVLFSNGYPHLNTNAYAEAVKVNQAQQQVPSFADVVQAVSPAVVSVRVQSTVQPVDNTDGFSFNFGGPGFDDLPDDHPMKKFFREYGNKGQQPNQQRGDNAPQGKPRLRPVAQGSGFFVSEDGYVVTNNHVVDDGAAYTVVMSDGTELPAKLVGKDQRTDLAVLKVDDKRKFSYVSFADDSKVRVGDWVVAVGNPFGLGGTVTAGIVSARGRDIGSGPYDDYLQVDAAVNRGNSGGPTFNLNGEVVGINTAIFSPSGGNVGIAFAIPASVAQGVVNDLMKSGTVERGWLGVQIQPVDQDIADSLGLSAPEGALVVAPQKDSPGEKAGIKQGDVITAVDGEAIKSPKQLSKMIGSMHPGSSVEVSLWRGGKATSVNLTIGTLPEEKAAASAATPDQQDQDTDKSPETLSSLGITVQPSDDGQGVEIASVDPNSEAADRGLKQGEKITSVNNQDVNSVADIAKVLDMAKSSGRKKALFQIQGEQGSRFIGLPIAQG